MITPDYCLSMARYNGWQNRQLKTAMEGLSVASLTEERGAFFGSILATANHLLWADQMWMHRLAGHPAPAVPAEAHLEVTDGVAPWALARFRVDSAMLRWAEGVHAVDLTGGLRWYSVTVGHELEEPMGQCIAHMFNHQTHHRGQIHAMLTQAGAKAPVSDLILMPKEGPWV